MIQIIHWILVTLLAHSGQKISKYSLKSYNNNNNFNIKKNMIRIFKILIIIFIFLLKVKSILQFFSQNEENAIYYFTNQ